MKEFLLEIKKETDLNQNDITSVLRKIPTFHSKLLEEYSEKLSECRRKEVEHDKVYKTIIEDAIRGETKLNVFSYFKTKEDREFWLRMANDKIIELNQKIKSLRDDLEFIEQLIKYLKDVKENIRILLDYQKFKSGI